MFQVGIGTVEGVVHFEGVKDILFGQVIQTVVANGFENDA